MASSHSLAYIYIRFFNVEYEIMYVCLLNRFCETVKSAHILLRFIERFTTSPTHIIPKAEKEEIQAKCLIL